MKQVLCALALLVLVALGLGIGGCDDSLQGTSFPKLQADPSRVVLTPVPVGQQTARVVALSNIGGSELIITHIDFTNATDEREFSKNHAALPIRLRAGEVAELRVVFSPIESVIGEGGVLVRSNDRDQPELLIPITTTNAQTGLTVEPEALQLVSNGIGIPVEGSVRLTNIGLVPVRVLDVFLTEESHRDFEPGADTAERPQLQLDEFADFTVRYTPSDGSPDRGELVILTNDPQYPRISVPLTGLLPRPAIRIEPGSVNFGAVDQGDTSMPQLLTVTNVGSAPLVVDRVELAFAAPPTNAQYRLAGLPDFPVTLEADSDDFFTVEVTYAPVDPGRHRTAVTFVSNDPVTSVATVPLDGRVRRPCISVTPDAVNLSVVAQGQTSARWPVQVANCGDMPLQVRSVGIDNPQYSWADPAGGQGEVFEIAPLSAVVLNVWYANVGLAQGAQDPGTLVIESNSPDDPTVEVPLMVTGGGAPSCNIAALPNRVDYGLVSRGSNRTRSMQLVNRGSGACELRSEVIAPLIPIPGLPQMFFLTAPVGARQIAPGEFVPYEITYRPRFFGADSAIYTATYFDPFLGEERSISVNVQGVSGESNIQVIPSRLDFGAVTAGECASRDERITVYNTGIVDLCIRDVRFEGACDEFFLVDRPRADADGCITVSRNAPADFIFNYEPGNLGPDECDVIFVSDAADNPNLRVPLLGQGVADGRQTDEFVQTSGRTVDVLFVVDNSGSMGEEQRNLRDNFASFIGGAQQFQNDYQLGIVTTDMDNANQSGRLIGPRILRRGPDVERQFRDTIQVGTNGSADERGLEAAQKALSDPLAFDTGVACQRNEDCMNPDVCVEGFCGGHNRGFLRDQAALEIVFVSDEDDHSPGTVNFYVDFFKNIKGFRNEGLFRANAIVGANNGRAASCNSDNGSADPGRRYVEVADRTNGEVYSICDANFGRSLREIGDRAFGLPVQFFLTRPAVPESVEVAVNGRPRAAGWVYDAPSNSVIFDEATVPAPNDRIVVNYNAECFARRN